MRKLILISSFFILANFLTVQSQTTPSGKGKGKPVLVEFFTNASCTYCKKYIAYVQNYLNKDTAMAIGIGYHMWWPGKDPMCSTISKPDATSRKTLYDNFTVVPQAFVDGVYYDDFLLGKSDSCIYQQNRKAITLEIQSCIYSLTGNTMTFSGDIVAKSAVSGNYVVQMVVIERTVTFATAPGTNGEKSFQWVAKKMIPSANGTALPATMAAGFTQHVSGSWTLEGTIYKQDQLKVVFFIQEKTKRTVPYSALAQLVTSTNDNSIANDAMVHIYPNPFRYETNINFNLTKPEKVSVNILNLLGRKVLSNEAGVMPQGENQLTIRTDNIIPGIYFIDIRTGSSLLRKKIVILK